MPAALMIGPLLDFAAQVRRERLAEARFRIS